MESQQNALTPREALSHAIDHAIREGRVFKRKLRKPRRFAKKNGLKIGKR